MKKIKYCLCILIVLAVVSPAAAKDTVKIAAIYALTGRATAANASSLQGVKNAVKELNGRGGVLGKPIQLLMFDNLSSPIGSHLAAEKAAAENVTAIIGASWSSHSLAIAKIAQEQGIPMISNYSTNPKVTRIGDYIFRVCFTDDFQGAILAKFAREDLKAESAAIFTDLTSDYSIGLSRIFRNNFIHMGGNVFPEIEYKGKQDNFDTQILTAKQMNADVIFLSGHHESGLIAKLLQQDGIPSIPLGGDGWSVRSFLSKGGNQLKKGFYCTHWSEFVESQRSKTFVQKYVQVGKTDAGVALAYDAVMVLADAIQRAGSTDRAMIRDTLADTRAFDGVTGTITFDDHGDPVKSVVIMEIKNGKPQYLKTLNP